MLLVALGEHQYREEHHKHVSMYYWLRPDISLLETIKTGCYRPNSALEEIK